MKQQDKLRTTLQEYYDNQEVPFNDGDWQRAGALLKAGRQKRKTRRVLILFSALVAVFSGLFFIVHNSTELTGIQKQNVSLSGQKQANPGTEESPQVVKPLELTEQNETALPKRSKEGQQNNPALVSTTKVSKDTLNSYADPVAIVEAPGLPEQTAMDQKSEVDRDAVNNDKISGKTVTTEINQTSIYTPSVEPIPGEKTASNNAISAPLNSSGDEPVVPPNELPQASENVLPIMVSTLQVNNDKNKETAARDTTNEVIVQNITGGIHKDSVPVNLSPDTISTPAIAAMDTTRGRTLNNDLLDNGFFLEAGATWFYGWKGLQTRDARGFSPIVGINYMNRLGDRSAFSFGLAYLVVPNLSNSSKTSRVSTYEYGGQSNVTVITPSSVRYLMAPLRLHWAVGNKTTFGAGINLAYLLDVYANVTTYKELPGSNTDYHTIKLGGYTQGFSQFDTQLSFCYRRRFCSALSLQAEVFLGLTDVKQDAFFGFNHKERNSGARLSLIYKVFRKKSKS